MASKALELPPNFTRATDAELGRWLVSAWLARMADATGMQHDAVTPEHVARWVAHAQRTGLALVPDGELQSALRDALDGNVSRAGARVRKHFTEAAMLAAVGPTFRIGAATKRAQSSRARKPRGDAMLARIVKRLASRDETAKELWTALRDKLDAQGCRPSERAGTEPRRWRIEYSDPDGGARHVTLDGFARMLKKARDTQ